MVSLKSELHIYFKATMKEIVRMQHFFEIEKG